MTTLTARAAAALRRVRLAEPTFVVRDSRRYGERRRLTRVISAVLGVDPADVTVTGDATRVYGGWHGYVITVADDDFRAYRFIPRVGTEDQFMILAPCPDCHAIVPVAEIYDLTDLGLYLDQMTAHDPNTPRPPEFDTDPGHHRTCPTTPTHDPPRRTRRRTPLSATPLQHATGHRWPMPPPPRRPSAVPPPPRWALPASRPGIWRDHQSQHPTQRPERHSCSSIRTSRPLAI